MEKTLAPKKMSSQVNSTPDSAPNWWEPTFVFHRLFVGHANSFLVFRLFSIQQRAAMNQFLTRSMMFSAQPVSIGMWVSPTNQDNIKILRKLAELQDWGIISSEEFEFKKKQLLGL